MADDHGNTPAAWAAVVVALAGFMVGGVGLILDNWPVFWVGVALVPIGLAVFGVLTKLGYGTSRH